MRVLLVEADLLLGRSVRAGLEQQGHAVDWVVDVAAAHTAIATHDYSVLVLDADFSKQDGRSLLATARADGCTAPAIVMAAVVDISDQVTGHDSGSDDFIVKPFDLEELNARLRSVVHRSDNRAPQGLVYGQLKVDIVARSVTLDDKPVTLTNREFTILTQLLARRGQVLSKQHLQEVLYNRDDAIESNTVEVHIHHLRRKLGRDLIRTLHGMGHMITAQ